MKACYKIVWPAVLLCIAIALGGCKKSFFEIEDTGGVDAGIWNSEGAVQFLLNGTYSVVMPDYPYEIAANNMYYSSDENLLSGYDATMKKVLGLNGVLLVTDVKFIGGKYQGTKGDNKYFDIARCNDAIKNLPGSPLPYESKRRFLGQFYALRAMTYFELTRLYGGVPLVREPQDPDNLTLSGRESAVSCFKAIVQDYDSAMSLLNGVVWDDKTERGKITQLAAACLKAKALLYFASPQFNPNNDADRWNVALKANKEAYDLCVNAGVKLMTSYSDIFLKEGTANTEAIVVRSYSNKLAKRFQGVEARARPSEEGGAGGTNGYAYTPTWNLVTAYNMKDGTPITTSPDYDPVLFWLNRDPRFDATIAYNGGPWKLSGKSGRRQWSYQGETVEGSKVNSFYVKRFCDPELPKTSVAVVEDVGGNGLDWIELRFAEVMLNYAECLNETGDLTGAKNLVREIRKRAGIIPGGAGNDYGLGAALDKKQMRDLLMNERQIEFAFEGKRYHDLRRTRRLQQLAGTIETIWFEPVSAAKKTELEAINPATGLRNRDTLNVNNKSSFLNYFKYPYAHAVISGNGAFAVPENNYFFPLPATFLQSSPLLVQTIGWDIGTFDPLQD